MRRRCARLVCPYVRLLPNLLSDSPPHAESPYCYRGPSKVDSRRFSGDTPIDAQLVSDIERRVGALHVEETLKARNLQFYVYQDFNYPVLSCNMSRLEQWRRNSKDYVITPYDRIILERNRANNFAKHAIEAAHRTIKAFALAKVPLAIIGGTMLGWYRQCGIIEHTHDMDFAVIADHIVSMEHFDLLVV